MQPLLFCLLAVTGASPAEQQDAAVQLDARSWKLDCARLESLREGRPIFFGSMTDVRVGIRRERLRLP